MAPGGEVDEEIVIKFAQKLAGNEKKYRDRALKKLKKWMQSRCQSGNGFTEDDMMKIWKGLHYCMWMADKPLVQEDLADSLCQLIHCFDNVDMSLLFVDVFFKTEAREWYGIDRLRLDKFMMLVRKFLRQTFTLVAQHGWKAEVVNKLVTVLGQGVASGKSDDVPEGLKYHIMDIYFDELERTGAHLLSEEQVQVFLDPYCVLMAETKSKALAQHTEKCIFDAIVERLYNEADEGQEDEEEEADEKEPRLQFDYQCIADRLFELASSQRCLSRNRSRMYPLVKKFQDLAKGILPEEEVLTSGSEDSLTENDVYSAMQRLSKFEEKLMDKTGKKKKEKRKKMEDHEGIEDLEPTKKKQKVMSTEDTKGKTQKTKNKFKGQNQVKVESIVTVDLPANVEKEPKRKKKKKIHGENSDAVEDASVQAEPSGEKISQNDTQFGRKNQIQSKKKMKQSPGIKSNSEDMPVFEGTFSDDDEDDDGIDGAKAALLHEVAIQNYEKKPVTLAQTSAKKKRASLGADVLRLQSVNSVTPGSSSKKKQKANRASLGSLPQTDTAVVFEGGFIDSDEETAVKPAQSAGKKKKISLNAGSELQSVNSSMSESVKKKKKAKKDSLGGVSHADSSALFEGGFVDDDAGRTGSSARVGSAKKIQKSKKDSSMNVQRGDSEAIFEGGFIDDEEDLHETIHVARDNSAKKKGKARKNSLMNIQKDSAVIFEGGFIDDDEDDSQKCVPTPHAGSGKKKDKTRKNSLGNIQKDSAMIFEGGFIDEDTEENVKETPKKKAKNERRKSRQSSDASYSFSIPETGETVIIPGRSVGQVATPSGAGEMALTDDASEETSGRNKKKSKRKSLTATSDSSLSVSGFIAEQGSNNGSQMTKNERTDFSVISNNIEVSSGTSSASKSKKKRKSLTSDVEEKNEGDPGFQIWIPNKKYKGKLKGLYEKEIAQEESQLTVNTSASKKTTPGTKSSAEPFAVFEKITKTPPAFVRKAVSKVSPKTEPKRTRKQEKGQTPGSMLTDSKKRVSFAMNKNMAQDFRESLNISPVVPFDPKVKPDGSILKSPASGTNTPALESPRKKLFKKRRSTAADFF